MFRFGLELGLDLAEGLTREGGVPDGTFSAIFWCWRCGVGMFCVCLVAVEISLGSI